MHLRIPLFLCLLLGFSSLKSQEVRTIDGTGNNIQNPTINATNSNFKRIAGIGYTDGISRFSDMDRPNPRVVSNEIFAQDSLTSDHMGLSDYTWVFGQFIDHDLTFSPDQPNGWTYIEVPKGDKWMDPFNVGFSLIAMRRSEFDRSTSTDINNPRQHINAITGFLDGSAVYGSDEHRADWLRTHENGKMRTSAGNLLPFNTTTGEYDAEIDHTAPEMDDAIGRNPKHFVAGDLRANENPLLASLHTLFVREHNRLCDELIEKHPDWDDEQLYQHARKIVGGYITSITYNQWLPAMGIKVPAYEGYNPEVDATISNLFASAAFRLGHTLLNGNLLRMLPDGSEHPEGNMSLTEAFFNIDPLREAGGMESFLKGMGAQMQQKMDGKVVNDVRNFLFGPPGAGGLDLASININRGRERGIPDFNTVRENIGLTRYTTFEQICSDRTVTDKLAELYGNVNNIDAWVGMLVEDHMDDMLFGETIRKVMMDQFTDLRDGDRFYYENDNALSDMEKADITNTMFVDIIRRNTDVKIMQPNVFKFMPHEMICASDAPNLALSGTISTESGKPISGVNINLINKNTDTNMESIVADGSFSNNNIPSCIVVQVEVEKADNFRDGVTTSDIVRLRRHILGTDRMTSPLRLIAADVNESGNVSTLDIVAVRRLILFLTDDFGGSVPAWRFYGVPADMDLATATAEDLTNLEVENIAADTDLRIIGVKIGDVNDSVDPALNGAVTEDRSKQQLTFTATDAELKTDELYEVNFQTEQAPLAFQMTLDYDASALELVSINGLNTANYNHLEAAHAVAMSWNENDQDPEADFTATFRARTNLGNLAEYIDVNSDYTPAIGWDTNEESMAITLEFNPSDQEVFAVQATPNPTNGLTNITIDLPAEDEVEISVMDVSGRVLNSRTSSFGAGANQLQLNAKNYLTAGVLYYQVSSSFGKEVHKIIVQ